MARFCKARYCRHFTGCVSQMVASVYLRAMINMRAFSYYFVGLLQSDDGAVSAAFIVNGSIFFSQSALCIFMLG
jgi:hypothetical protein